ncbi:Cytochrome c oxidase subunit 5b-1 [Raphanus sativus]|uniref:Cytochrome c oxidase subunit 5b-1, mitochondrial n=1 Tax=Raphanus sativus TaxID=3726 RepID=A0A6J0PA03_RAPSA|nr:cytochrome c oxidase subunit 5b-1, mitochondrial [Raphanus sativus]KAJ4893720.1 Cytochrome c oxidase subunit 5b-1 [Raphanus sativus]
MWRRIVSSGLKTLASDVAAASPRRSIATTVRPVGFYRSANPASSSLIPRHFSSESVETVVAKKKVEDVMPIATGHEKEELQAELEGRRLLDIDFPEGPFGTKESPAIVKSYYDKRIVGCPGGEGEDEHDVVWFWLEKGKSFECPVCTQYFELEVVGPGGPPDGHGDEDDEHHH